MTGRVAVIDYGMGNLFSVLKALEVAGLDAFLAASPGEAAKATHLVLPGVGAFGEGMSHLEKQGFVSFLREWSLSEKPLLGICLGLQLLFEKSEEFGDHSGLGLLPGRVVPFSPELGKVPHVGWNQVTRDKEHFLWANLPETLEFYFVHSYHASDVPEDVVLGRTDYQLSFASVAGRGMTVGVQFHPEKSQDLGIAILRNFGKVKNAAVSCD
ncbi:MAG: imidazole glycerol phosphate synthase subunit HisH [Leptospirales bacterium]